MQITEEQRAAMLVNGHEYARNPHFNPQTVVKLFDQLVGAVTSRERPKQRTGRRVWIGRR